MALDKADLVLHEGAVLGHPNSDSVAIADGRIAAHGRFEELKALVGPRTHLIRLEGRTVAPGFIDCHLHFMEGAAVVTGLPAGTIIAASALSELTDGAAVTVSAQ